MVDAVKQMLMGQANKDYLKKVEERKKQEKQLEEEVEKLKQKAAESEEDK